MGEHPTIPLHSDITRREIVFDKKDDKKRKKKTK